MTFDGRLAKTDLRKIASTQFRKVLRSYPLLKLPRSALRSWSISDCFDTGQSAEEQLFDYRSIVSIYAGRACRAAEAEAVKLFGLTAYTSLTACSPLGIDELSHEQR
jgi:hypothetical protein